MATSADELLSSIPPRGHHSRSSSFSAGRNAAISDQIRQLEMEGSLLRSQVNDILQTVAPRGTEYHDSRSRTASTSERPRTPIHHRSSSLDAIMGSESRRPDSRNYVDVADSRTEQQALENITSKLDAQQAAVANLQQRLRTSQNISPASRYTAAPPPIYPSRTEVFLPPSSLERELRDAKDQLDYFKNQLRISSEKAMRDKSEFKSQVDSLRARLYEAQNSKDSITQMRAKEIEGHEELINRLQYSLQSLQEANRQQEEALIDTNKQLDEAQKNHYLADNAVRELRNILSDIETRRGRPFFPNDPVVHQPISMLIETLDRCLQDYTSDIESRIQDIYTLQKEVSDVRQIGLREREDVETQWREKLLSVKEGYESQLQKFREQSVETRQNIEGLEGKLKLANEELKYYTESKVDRIKELEEKLSRMTGDFDKDRIAWTSKREALETGIDEVQKELAVTKKERDELVRNVAILETKAGVNDQQNTDLKSEVEQMQKSLDEAEEFQDKLRQQLDELKDELGAKKVEVLELKRLLTKIHSEATEMTRDEVERALAEEKEFASNKIDSLKKQLKDALEKTDKHERKLKDAVLEIDEMRENITSMSDERVALDKQLMSYQQDQRQMQELLSNRDKELERLGKERDYYYTKFNEKTESVAVIQSDYQHLLRVFEDRSHELSSFESDIANKYSEELSAKQWALDEIKHNREAIIHKLRLRDKKLHDTLVERDNAKAELTSRLSEIERLENERDALYLELKDSRFELAGSKEENGAALASLKREKDSLQRKVVDLTAKLSDMKCELQLARETLKVKETAHRPSSGVLSNRLMTSGKSSPKPKRNQLDAANRQVKALQDQVEQLEKQKALQTDDMDKVNCLLRKVKDQNDRLSKELDIQCTKQRDYKSTIDRLEADNTKLMSKLALCQKHISDLEQKAVRNEVRSSFRAKPKLQLDDNLGASPYQRSTSPTSYPVRNRERPSSASGIAPSRSLSTSRRRRPSDSGTTIPEPAAIPSETSPVLRGSSPVEDLLTSRSDSGDNGTCNLLLSPITKRLLRQRYPNLNSSLEDHGEEACLRLQDKIHQLAQM